MLRSRHLACLLLLLSTLTAACSQPASAQAHFTGRYIDVLLLRHAAEAARAAAQDAATPFQAPALDPVPAAPAASAAPRTSPRSAQAALAASIHTRTSTPDAR